MITYNEFVDYLKDEADFTDLEIALALYCMDMEYGGYLGTLEEFGYEEADRETYQEALERVADYYYVKYIDRASGLYECAGMNFYVFDDYDEAKEIAVEQEQNLIEYDIGIESIDGWKNYVDEDWFEDAMRESYDSYAEDIASESDPVYGTRLVQECIDNNLISDDDFREDEDGNIDYTDCRYPEYELQEMLSDFLCEDMLESYSNAVEWYIDNFGEESFEYAVKNNNLVDYSELAEYVVRTDGVAKFFAGYDGEEREYEFDGTTYYIYRD